MSRYLSLLAILLICLPAIAGAQQANQNINVLPVYFNEQDDPVGFPIDPDAQLKGDLFLQRQLEPTLAVSTRNPDHLISFFVDYRAVDIPDDPGLGEGEAQDGVQIAGQLDEGSDRPPLPAQAAAAEAWIGGSRSYDGGLTWSGFFLPGALFDTSPASLDAPIFGLEAATDPVASAGPCGCVYVAFVAFTRGGASKMMVAKYVDLNNDEGGDTWVYDGMTLIEEGNNGSFGTFIDKPFLLVDPQREDGGDPCAHNVYVSYSTFNGQDKTGKFRSKLTFARSTDGGQSFDLQKINMPFKRNQGTWMAVDPRPGTPQTTGGGTIYLFWRHFFDPAAILMIRSFNYGQSFPGQPDQISGDLELATFDQPTLATTAVANPVTDIAFRSNGFPTATASGEGAAFVAWQERVDIDPTSPGFGLPDPFGSPRIVMMRSVDGGDTWTDVDGVEGQRRALDFGDRDDPADPNLPEPGFGALPQNRPSGAQVMPSLSCGGGRCMLTYYESRGLLGIDPVTGKEIIQPTDLTATTEFISGIDRMTDLRAALIDPLTGQRLSTTQVSRYTIQAAADFSDDETVDDVVAVNSPCLPDDEGAGAPCERRVHRSNKPQSGSGTSPFQGDYNFLTPTVQFVPTQDRTGWRWATEPEDVPYQAFHAIWADNRNLIPPTEPAELPEWGRYASYGPPGIGGACVNAGSRNTDTLTARVDADLILSAPTTYKQLDARRTFPLSLTNGTGEDRFYRLTLTTGAEGASFALQEGVDIDTGDVQIFPYSTISQVVYVEGSLTGPIQVVVQEIDAIGGNLVVGGEGGTATFNLDDSNPVVPDLGTLETFDPAIVTTEVSNPFAINPFAINSSPSNPFAINPFAINPFAINNTIYDIVDTTWTVTGGNSNTASSYLPLINIDNLEAFLDSYSFQLVIYKTSTYGALNAAACESYNLSQDQILSSVVQDPANPFAINPFAINPFAINPFAINPFAINSAFTMSPADGDSGAGFAPQSEGLFFDDGTTKAPRAREVVKILLRSYQLAESPDFVFDPTEDPPSLVLVPLPCDPQDPAEGCNIVSTAPDLVPTGVAPPDPLLAVDQDFLFPLGGWTLENQGNNEATAENRDLRHGVYLSTDEVVDLSLAGEPQNGDILLGFQSSVGNTLAPGEQESFDQGSLTIPAETAAGDYFLILFVDDFTEVSEDNEVNNVLAFPVTVEAPNSPPQASPDSYTIDEDEPLQGQLSGSDPDEDPLIYEIVDPAEHGTVTLTDPTLGTFLYSPEANFNGQDSFTFRLSDGELDSEVAAVSITVNAVNDAPEATQGLSFSLNEDQPLVGQLSGVDVEGDGLIFSIVTNGSIGTATITDPGSGAFTYAPNPDANGSDSFSFRVNDGQLDSSPASVQVTVSAVNDPPVALSGALLTDEDTPADGTLVATDADGDSLIFSIVTNGAKGLASITDAASGQYTYTPEADAEGADSFTFRASDGQLDSPPASIQVTISAVNDPPVAVDDAVSSQENGTVSFDPTENDVDVDGDLLTLLSVDDPAAGSVDLEGNQVSYTPDPNFVGLEVFEYQIRDAPGATATGTITVTVEDSVPDLGFLGLQAPWREPPPIPRAKVGSSFPLVWQYADPNTGVVVESSGLMPEVRIRGPFDCNVGESGDELEMVSFPGASGFQYDAGTDTHQFNWDSSFLEIGCYNVRIFSQLTRQLDGPFIIRLRP